MSSTAFAGHGGGGHSNSSSSSSSSSGSSRSSSSSSSSSSGSSHSSGSSSSHSSGSSGGGSRSSSSSSGTSAHSSTGGGSHGGGGGSWGGYHGTVRDHRHPDDSGPVIRDHRHPEGGHDGIVVPGGGSGTYTEDGVVIYDAPYDVVGYREANYGSWGRSTELPTMTFEIGMRSRRFADPIGAMSALEGSDGYSVIGGAGADNAVTTQFRFLYGLHGPVYLGAEGELGGLVSAPPVHAEGNLPSMDARSATVFGGYGVIGAMTRSGKTSFGVELAAGGRSLLYSFKGHGTEWSASTSQGVVEPRARAEYWLSPFVSLGAQIGANVVEKGDWNAGGYFAFHTRAYSGN